MRLHQLRRQFCAAALTTILLVGCEANHYEISMEPVDAGLSREIVCWRSSASQNKTTMVQFPLSELKQLATAYDATPEGPGAVKHKFSGVFAKAMPVDVGGSGSYTHWDSPLGSVSVYVERFRGDDDLLADVERRQAAADQFTDLLLAWLSSELDTADGFPKLEQFVQNDFRRDLKNLCLYLWAAGVMQDPDDDLKAGSEWIMRIDQYLIERDYFSPEQLPILLRAGQFGDVEPALDMLAALIGKKMELPESDGRAIAFLSSPELAQDSLMRFLRSTEPYRQALAEWEQSLTDDPDAEKPDPLEVVGAPFVEALLPNFSIGRSDRLAVTLKAARRPFATNGNWDQQTTQIGWKRGLLPADSENTEFPSLLFALWSDPNEAAQMKRFGKVVVEKEKLAWYCVWYRGLTNEEAQQWDDFLSKLTPGERLADDLAEFHFEGDEHADLEDVDLAAMAREMLIRGFGGDESPK